MSPRSRIVDRELAVCAVALLVAGQESRTQHTDIAATISNRMDVVG